MASRPQGSSTAALSGFDRSLALQPACRWWIAGAANAMLRVLWSRLGKPHIGGSSAYAFNVPSVSGVGRLTTSKNGGKSEVKSFSNGETSVNINTSVRDQDVFIVQSGSSNINDSVMEILIMISACKGGSAKSITGALSTLLESPD